MSPGSYPTVAIPVEASSFTELCSDEARPYSSLPDADSNPDHSKEMTMPQSRAGARVLPAALMAIAFALPVHGAEPEPVTAPSTSPGFDPSNLDRSADPCTDFYQLSCGGWLKANPVPADQSSWGQFNLLAERNRNSLKEILEKAAAGGPGRAPLDQRIGDFYASCMDETAVEKLGVEALRPELDRIERLGSTSELPELIASLHSAGVGALFSFSSTQDFKDTKSVIADADQGGLGLPERDYYFKDDPKSVELRQDYVSHVQRMFELLGEKPQKAAADAATVMNIETALAKASLTVVQRRDPNNLYHKMSRAELASLNPTFDWSRYLRATEAPAIDSLNVDVPDFFKAFEAQLKAVSLDQWKTYLRWHLVHDAAPVLSPAFVNENFAFYGRTLTGAKELRPRWKRCVDLTDNLLGEALGQRYVEATFGAQGKERTLKMVGALEKALDADLKDLPWMTEATKKQALGKLAAIANKIGYPDKWRDYGTVQIARGDLAGNARRATAFEVKRQLDKIGKPVDRGEWGMTPPTVNAYYSPLLNDINFPAGILQPPFYDNEMDDAVNFGGIGSVIGHEITHGFDDEGRQFAADGTLNDWWTETDAKEFEKRADCFVQEYGSFVAVDDVKLNGKLTLGENTADNGGVRIAYMALLQTLGDAAKAKPIDGFTPEQRFFLGWGQIWCQNRTPESERLRAQTDPHSPGRYRVNGVVSNMPEFWKAFGCKPGSAMVRENACRVW
jgi:endothelin-converting enzyme/putative endopeptidase